MDVVAVLLAAGESERMGAPKALVDWRGQPLLTHQLQQIQKSAVCECVVVLGREIERLRPLVDPTLRPGWKARAAINPAPDAGKASSILIGLGALWSRPEGIVVASVDQPLDARLLDALIAAAEQEWERCTACQPRTIILPVYHGRRGHPALFSSMLLGEMMGISETGEGLKSVVRRDPSRVLEVPWESSEILLNLNQPLDLLRADPRGPQLEG